MKHQLKRTLSTAAALLLFSAVAARAEDPMPRAPTPKEVAINPTRIVLFKNGLGLVDSRIDLSQGDGQYRVTPLPDSTLGMFWLSSSKGVALDGIKATSVMKADKKASTLGEMLAANLGKTVEIRQGDKWRTIHVVSIPVDESSVAPYDLYGNPRNAVTSIPIPAPGLTVIATEADNTVMIPIGAIQEIRLASKDAGFMVEKAHPAMEFSAAGTAKESDVQVSILAQGINWAPSYLVDISEEKKARVYAKAIISNDLMDLEKVKVELVTGYPNLEYANVPDMFSLTPLAQILSRMQSRDNERNSLASNVMAQQMAYGGARDAISAPGVGGTMDGSVHGESSEDLYFYPIKEITLKKGERAYAELFSAQVEYEHCYTWEIGDFVDEYNRYAYDNNQQKPAPQVVWHSLSLTNKSGLPWTTGTAATVKGARVLGQSTLNYTPDGATTELRITQVASAHAEQNETEVERKRNAAQFFGSTFDLVTVKGELELTNYSAKTLPVKITKILSGEVQQSDGKPTITKLARGLRKVNPQSQLVWNVTVEPGKDKAVTVKYTYQVYVRE